MLHLYISFLPITQLKTAYQIFKEQIQQKCNALKTVKPFIVLKQPLFFKKKINRSYDYLKHIKVFFLKKGQVLQRLPWLSIILKKQFGEKDLSLAVGKWPASLPSRGNPIPGRSHHKGPLWSPHQFPGCLFPIIDAC